MQLLEINCIIIIFILKSKRVKVKWGKKKRKLLNKGKRKRRRS